jgi:hypothetical protein
MSCVGSVSTHGQGWGELCFSPEMVVGCRGGSRPPLAPRPVPTPGVCMYVCVCNYRALLRPRACLASSSACKFQPPFCGVPALPTRIALPRRALGIFAVCGVCPSIDRYAIYIESQVHSTSSQGLSKYSALCDLASWMRTLFNTALCSTLSSVLACHFPHPLPLSCSPHAARSAPIAVSKVVKGAGERVSVRGAPDTPTPCNCCPFAVLQGNPSGPAACLVRRHWLAPATRGSRVVAPWVPRAFTPGLPWFRDVGLAVQSARGC